MPADKPRRRRRRIAMYAIPGLLGALGIAAFLSFTPDLRGWPSADDAGRLEATTPSGRDFQVSECLPWTISLHDQPTSEEYAGTATLEVVSCRSQRSLLHWLGLFTGVLAALFVASLELRPRKSEGRR